MAPDQTTFPSDEELGQALKENLRACPICQGAEWHATSATLALPVQDHADGAVHIQPKDDSAGFDFQGALALPVMCGDCGFLALFHLDTLLGRGQDAGG